MPGFTLIEILLTVAIIALFAGIALPLDQALQNRSDLNLAVSALAQTLRRTQVLAQAVDGDTSWGVKVQTGSITLFKGPNFLGRDPAFDEAFDIGTQITPSGLEEVVFSKFSGLPQATGTIIFARFFPERTMILT